MKIINLPQEILFKILQKLNIKDSNNFKQCNKLFLNIYQIKKDKIIYYKITNRLNNNYKHIANLKKKIISGIRYVKINYTNYIPLNNIYKIVNITNDKCPLSIYLENGIIIYMNSYSIKLEQYSKKIKDIYLIINSNYKFQIRPINL